MSLKVSKKSEDIFENLKQMYLKEELLQDVSFSYFLSILTTSKIKENILFFTLGKVIFCYYTKVNLFLSFPFFFPKRIKVE